MAKHKVEIAGVNTTQLKTLTAAEMKELFVRLKDGDLSVRDEIIKGNFKLVLSILKKYTNRCENMDDLFQVGCIGLIKAIDNFDLKHEVCFSTYAVPMILGEVRRHIRDYTTMRVSRSIKDQAMQIIRYKEQILTDTGREATKDEICTHLKISPYELRTALDSMKDAMSMFEPIYNDGSEPIYLADQISDNSNSIYDQETKLALMDGLERIKTKERYVLLKRYIIGQTQVELSNELGISQAQISRLEKNGINELKRYIKGT